MKQFFICIAVFALMALTVDAKAQRGKPNLSNEANRGGFYTHGNARGTHYGVNHNYHPNAHFYPPVGPNMRVGGYPGVYMPGERYRYYNRPTYVYVPRCNWEDETWCDWKTGVHTIKVWRCY